MSAACCPTCGQSVEDVPTLLVATDGSVVARYGVTARLTPKPGAVFGLLHKRYPAMVTHDALIRELYWRDDEPEWSHESLRVHVSRLRLQLAPLGLGIENVWHAGYRLVFHDKPIERAAE